MPLARSMMALLVGIGVNPAAHFAMFLILATVLPRTRTEDTLINYACIENNISTATRVASQSQCCQSCTR